MKKLMLIALLSATVGSAWGAAARPELEKMAKWDGKSLIFPYVAESLYNGRNQGFLWLPSVSMIVDALDLAVDNNDVKSAKLLLATLRAFKGTNEAMEFNKEYYNTRTLPILRQYGFKFGKPATYGGIVFPARDFPADEEL